MVYMLLKFVSSYFIYLYYSNKWDISFQYIY